MTRSKDANASPANAAMRAIQTGDVSLLRQLLAQHGDLVTGRVDGQRTLLHVATDWPGHFPNNTAAVNALIAFGADVNAAFHGPHRETPLHWAASSDDVAVLDALLDHGAAIEAQGACIGGGTALANAVAFGQWQAARRLIERGAVSTLWQAAALGLMERVAQFFTGDAPPAPSEITNAFWCACHGGRQEPATYLLEQGAALNWVGYDGLTPLDAAQRSGSAPALVSWLRNRGGKSASELN